MNEGIIYDEHKSKKIILCILSSMAVVLFLTSGAVSASTKTYRDHHDNAVVTVHKRAGKVTSVVYQLKHANKYKKRYQKRSRFYTKVSVINSKTAKLIRKNYKGTVTFNDKMRYYGHLYASEQTTPIKGMTGDATDAIFMNVAYYGKILKSITMRYFLLVIGGIQWMILQKVIPKAM